MSNHENEEILTGGEFDNVYRSGDTGKSRVEKDSPKIHKLSKHLENKGFSYAPKYLGIDEKGREILSFIEGEAGNYPLKEYMWSNDVLKEIAKMLRLYHDSVSDFSFDDSWESIDNTPQPFEVLCHNDFAIYNIIFNHQKPVGIIDFDIAGPGPRLWDIAYTLYTCVPLSRVHHSETGEAVYYNPLKDADHIKQRVKLFFESYGIEGMEKGFLEMVLLRLEGLCKYMRKKSRYSLCASYRGNIQQIIRCNQSDIKFIREHGNEWI